MSCLFSDRSDYSPVCGEEDVSHMGMFGSPFDQVFQYPLSTQCAYFIRVPIGMVILTDIN